MFQSLRTAAVAAGLAFASAVPAAAVVYEVNFDIEDVDLPLGPLFGKFSIDFGDFNFEEAQPDQTSGLSVDDIGGTYEGFSSAVWNYSGPPGSILEVSISGIGVIEEAVEDYQNASIDLVFKLFFPSADSMEFDSGRISSRYESDAGLVITISRELESGEVWRIARLDAPPPAAAVIPLPAAGWLLLGGLGALGALRRRRA